MNKLLPHYPKVLALGKYATINWPWYAEEKLDGSQISFGVLDGKLVVRSKNQHIDLDNVPDLFVPAVTHIRGQWDKGNLPEGWIFRGEAFKSNKHNVLSYDRTPSGDLVIFDIQGTATGFIDRQALTSIAYRLGFDVAPMLASGTEPPSMDDINGLLDTESMLGGVPVEGLVFKPRDRSVQSYNNEPIVVKYVSEKFKEKHEKAWGAPRKAKSDIVALIAGTVSNEARWRKAVQHLEEVGALEWQPRDIPKVLEAVQRDIEEEEAPYIKDKLYEMYRRDILKASCKGVASWYKETLAQQALSS